METNPRFETLQLAVGGGATVTANLGIPVWWPSGNRVGVVLAHHVGANMDQESLVWLQSELVDRGHLTIRFNFPYAELGKKRPDAPAVLARAYRQAVSGLMRDPQEAPACLVFAGFGLGARVAAQILAAGAKADGLICMAYPLHAAGKPSEQKADALFRVICPIQFIQGTRDTHCRIDRLETLLKRVGAPTSLDVIEEADHELELIKRAPRTPEQARAEILNSVHRFIARLHSN